MHGMPVPWYFRPHERTSCRELLPREGWVATETQLRAAGNVMPDCSERSMTLALTRDKLDVGVFWPT